MNHSIIHSLFFLITIHGIINVRKKRIDSLASYGYLCCLDNMLLHSVMLNLKICSQKFGEIAFCAIMADEQVKGYGTRLMNHLKQHARDVDGLTHFLTYADNNAVGYFVKQVLHFILCMKYSLFLG